MNSHDRVIGNAKTFRIHGEVLREWADSPGPGRVDKPGAFRECVEDCGLEDLPFRALMALKREFDLGWRIAGVR